MKSHLHKILVSLFLITCLFATKTTQAQYCVDNLYTIGCQYGDYINDVTISNISQTATGCGTNGYSDYTNLSADLEQGSTNTLSLTIGNYGEYVSMWIDFNDDYNFDVSEKLVSNLYCGTSGVTYSANFFVPPFVTLGNHRMRVRCVQYTYPFTACGSYYAGEVHDYTAHIIPPTNMSVVSTTTTQTNNDPVTLGSGDVEIIGIQVVASGSLSPLSATSFTLNGNGTTNLSDITGVKIYYSGTSATFSPNSNIFFGSASDFSNPITGNQTLVPGVNHFWVAYDVSQSATIDNYLDAECTSITVEGSNYTPDITAPAGNRQIGYCSATVTNGCYYAYIDGVELNTLSNTFSFCNGNLNGYIYYSNLTTALEQGSAYAITLTGPAFEPVGFGVWIDFNNDGDFGDPDEFVFSSTYVTSGVQTGNITIPSTASIGNHRMRVRCRDYSYVYSSDACGEFYAGETEDYTISVSTPTDMTYFSSTCIQPNSNIVTLGSTDQDIIGVKVVTQGSLNAFNLTSLTINSNGSDNFIDDVTNVKVYYTGIDPTFNTNTLFGSATDLSSPVTGSQALVAGTNYFWVTYDINSTGHINDALDAECSQIVMDGNGGTQTPSVTAPIGNRIIDYCFPTNAYYGCYWGYIDGVEFNTLSNTSTNCNGNTNSYIQYDPSQFTTSVQAGGTYPILLTGPLYDYVSFGVWIDFNNDGDFDDAGEFAWTSPYPTNGTQIGSVAIPSDATIDEHRMRIRSYYYGYLYSSQSCGDLYYYGESEDYTISITPPTDMAYSSSTTTQTVTGPVSSGAYDQQIIGIEIHTEGILNPFNVTSFSVNDNGTTNSSDISNVKIYYTGSSPTFSTSTLFGSTTDLSNPITGSQTLAGGTDYFWVAYDISSTAAIGDFLDAECTQIVMDGNGGTQVPSITAPAGNREINYCIGDFQYGCYYTYIDGVVLNTLSNTYSYCNGNANGYILYPQSGNTTTQLDLGQAYTLELDAGYSGTGFGVWVDLNGDGDFDDVGEFVYQSTYYNYGGAEFGTITLPCNSDYVGDRRMRVRAFNYYIPYSGDACTSSYYGETEDYIVTLAPSVTQVYNSSTCTQYNQNPVSNNAYDAEIIGIQVNMTGCESAMSATSFMINSNGSSDFPNDVSNVKIYYTGSSSTFSPVNLFGSSTDLSSAITGSQQLTSGINYFWVAYDVSSTATIGDVIDAECTSIELTGQGTVTPDVTAPAGNRLINYCVGDFYYGCYFCYIDGVVLNTLSNLYTYCNGNSNGYILYPQSGNTTTEMQLGSTYSLELDGSYGSATGFGVWIDYNGDGDFDDADEFVYQSPYYTYGPQYGSINLPCTNDYAGDRRMRVRAFYYYVPYSWDACTSSYYGETEDYIITLSPAVGSQTYNSSLATQNNQNIVGINTPDAEIIGVQVTMSGCDDPQSATSFTINSNGSTSFTDDVSNVKIYYTGTSPVFATTTLFGSSTDLSSPITGSQELSVGTNYFWVAYDVSSTAHFGDYLDAECTGIELSGAGAVTPTVTAPYGNRQINYCMPTSYYGCYYSYIDQLTFNSLSNLYSGCNGNTNGYILYDPSQFTTNVQGGNSYALTLTTGPSYIYCGVGVWIDYNNDGDFGDANEFVYGSPNTGTNFSTNVTIPIDPTYYGERRMRVIAAYYSTVGSQDYCYPYYYYAETEDYTITVDAPPACSGVPTAGVITADPIVLCDPGNTTTMTLSGYSIASDLTFQWQSSSDGSNYSNISGETNTTYAPTLNSTTYYRVKVKCTNSNQSAFTDEVKVNVGGDEQITSTTDATICGEGNVTISASSNTDLVLWYNSATDVLPTYYSSSPSDFSPYVNSTTTYYVAAANGQINNGNVGPVNDSIGITNPYYTYNYEMFDVLKPCTLEGVYVYPQSAGDVVFYVYDYYWNYVGYVQVPVTQDQVNKKTFIPFNMSLNVGTQYKLEWVYPSVNLMSNDNNGTPYDYPYTLDNVISITGSNYGTYYYFYAYDWVIDYSELCSSPKTAITITETPSNEFSVTTDPATATICNNSGQSVSLDASGGGYTSFTWSPADGLTSTSGSNVSASPTQTTSYFVLASDGSCSNMDTVTVSVVDPPNVTITATPDAVCNGGSSQLVASVPATSYTVSQITFDPVEYNGGTVVPMTYGQVSNALPIGFNFNFYGNNYSQFYISANAWLAFDQPYTAGCCQGQLLPDPAAPNNVIAMAWEEYNPSLGGTIRYFTTGTAPFRKCVIEFKDVPHYYNVDLITVQAILYETTNVIEIHTTSMPGNPNYYWAPHTEGIENADGSQAVTVPGRNQDATWTASNDAWRFSPPQLSYSWSPSNTLDDAAVFNPVASPNSTTTYTATVTDVNTLCSSTPTVTVSLTTTPTAGTITPDISEYCSLSNGTLTLLDYSPGATIQWQESSTSGGPYTDISGATEDSYTPSTGSTTYYVAKVSCQSSATSDEASMIIDQPPLDPTAIDGGNCGPGSVVLGAQGSGNGDLNWYFDASGNSYLGSGTPFSSPYINQTTTFYVSEGNLEPTPLTTTLSGFYTSNGNMFDITAVNDVVITGFDINMNNYYTSDIEVYYKQGTYAGSEYISSDWTLLGIAPSVTGGGYGVATPLNLPLYVDIPAGETGAFYITCANYYSYLSNQYGSSPGNVYVQDNNIQVKEGVSNYYPFSYAYSPYVWDGVVHYIAPGCASGLTPVEAQIYAPQVSASANLTICEGTTVILDAVNNGNGNFNYEWMPQIPSMIPPDGLDDTVSVTPFVTTTFTVSVTDPTAPLCDTTISVEVTVNPTPAVFISNLDPQYYDNEGAFTLDGVPAGGTFSGPGVSGNQFNPSSLADGTYTITYTYTDANGCTGTYSQEVTIVPIEGIDNVDIGRGISIYPNPSEGIFNLSLALPLSAESVVITVYDAIGRNVFVHDFGHLDGKLLSNFDFGKWAKGVYQVKVSIDGQNFFRKITIQ